MFLPTGCDVLSNRVRTTLPSRCDVPSDPVRCSFQPNATLLPTGCDELFQPGAISSSVQNVATLPGCEAQDRESQYRTWLEKRPATDASSRNPSKGNDRDFRWFWCLSEYRSGVQLFCIGAINRALDCQATTFSSSIYQPGAIALTGSTDLVHSNQVR